MELRNKETGKIEHLDFDSAQAAVEAGTHAHVNRAEGETAEPGDEAETSEAPEKSKEKPAGKAK